MDDVTWRPFMMTFFSLQELVILQLRKNMKIIYDEIKI